MKMFRFEEIDEPRMVALIVGNGSGSKLLQSYVDKHEQVYMIPAYPLLYFYPHWESWLGILGDRLDWEKAISLFCEKHASVIDSRRIPGFNGLTTLGESKNEYLSIDEDQFRDYLLYIIQNEPLTSRTFLLSIHYAYALCNGEDLKKKRIILYHIHFWEYLVQYLSKDFPDVKVVAMTRDPRPNLERRLMSNYNVDKGKLDKSDAVLCKARNYYWTCKLEIFNGLEQLNAFEQGQVVVVKHEDLGRRLESVMRHLASFMGIEYSPLMLNISFGGKKWWSDPIYGRGLTNRFNDAILASNWRSSMGKVDWFVMEGIMMDYFMAYGMKLFLYKHDSLLNNLLLMFAILVPSKVEIRVFLDYLRPTSHIRFLKKCLREAGGTIELKDYTWNATYLFKPIYSDLKLWKPRWPRSKIKKSYMETKSVLHLVSYAAIYIFLRYLNYIWTIMSYPGLIFKRWILCYHVLFRRWKRKACAYPGSV